MKDLNNLNSVKKLPTWLVSIPFVDNIATTIYPYIYLPENMLLNLQSENPEIWNISVLIHEKIHLKRQKEYGVYKWCIKYLLNKKFRLNEELIAIEEQMIYLYQKNQVYPIEYKVNQFASSTYFWVTTKNEAKRILEILWSKVKDQKTE